MSKQNEDAIKQLAGVVAQLANIIISYHTTEEAVVGGVCGAARTPESADTAIQGSHTFDPNLKGSDLVREHFRRGGGTINCLRSDTSDAHAICRGLVRTIVGVDSDGDFITDQDVNWRYAVAYDDSGAVLTASELLG